MAAAKDKGLFRLEGKDYVTLMTCTPYGINTHRLLVRGKRIENNEKELFFYCEKSIYFLYYFLWVSFSQEPCLLPKEQNADRYHTD